MTLGSHQQTVGKSQTHLTPKWIVDLLGPFDLDPCAAYPRPWNCARENYTEEMDGLSLPWEGRVWLNPPFDRYQVGKWVQRLAEHGDGILLVHARTETDWFSQVWKSAGAILFLRHRLHFCRQDGTPHPANSGAPIVLASFGDGATLKLAQSPLDGVYVREWETRGGLS